MSFVVQDIKRLLKEQIKAKKEHNIVPSLEHEDDILEDIIIDQPTTNGDVYEKGRRNRKA